MNIRAKVLLFSFVLLSLLSAGLTAGVIYQLKQRAEAELAGYRENELKELRTKLKSLVDIAYASLEADHGNLRDKHFVETQYGRRLRDVIDIAEAVARSYMAQVKQGRLALPEAQAQALATIKNMRYDNGTGYVWINDTKRPLPRILIHPAVPALEGKTVDDPRFDGIALNRTTNLFHAFLDICERQGGGYVDYVWSKPVAGELIPDVPKLSYVRLLPEWGWIMGTGIYIDDVEQELLEKIKANLRKMRYDAETGYFWINDSSSPYPLIVMHPLFPELEGKPMQGGKYDSALNTPSLNLGQAFVKAAAGKGGGYVEYTWPKPAPDGVTTPLSKLAYLKLYQPLGWIIGTGMYIDDIDRKIAEKRAELKTQIDALINRMLVFTGILFAVVTLILSILLRRFLSPLLRVNRQLQILAQGKPAEEKFTYRGKDEIADIICSFGLLRKKTRAVIEQARAIAGGDYSLNIQHVPKDDQLATALADMTFALQTATEKNARQHWLKTGQTRLHECMRGEQNVLSLAENAIKFLSAYLQAHVGLFYLANADNDKEFLSLFASCGFERRKHLANRIRPGEGLAGQAALEKKLICIIGEAETGNSFISNAACLLAIPFFHEKTLKGIIELGSAEEFTEVQQEFLELVVQDIGIAVNSAQFHVRRADG
ncbi:MAG: GAF domain-containing protein [Gammaproteobacteria bacterium]|nr:GAF domain-containing protein [Gammaproteobacteria bacterium]